MKVILILMFLLANNNQLIGNYFLNQRSSFYDISNTISKEVYTRKELISNYDKKGYKLIYVKNHKNKIINNCFFIFEHIIQDKNFAQNRILVLTKLKSRDNYEIIFKLDNIIYDKNYTMTCYTGDNKESFNKIATKSSFITIEQNECTNTLNEIVHEYFTFKYDHLKNEYFLIKYSSTKEQTKIGDEYLLNLLTEKEFGEIKLINFSNKEFKKIIEKN